MCQSETHGDGIDVRKYIEFVALESTQADLVSIMERTGRFEAFKYVVDNKVESIWDNNTVDLVRGLAQWCRQRVFPLMRTTYYTESMVGLSSLVAKSTGRTEGMFRHGDMLSNSIPNWQQIWSLIQKCAPKINTKPQERLEKESTSELERLNPKEATLA